MWRCLVFVVAVTLWTLQVAAVPQGDNTCQGVVKHPVKVRVNVTEPVTFRTYTWCLRVPPRCSKYIVQMRERVKEQIELHNRTITVCCRGYVEMESKCVPGCPPMTECPNMHCNRTNHCYCSPGYSGVFCNDPCPKGSWGRDCKKPCDCPDGFTCHHLTGDCMLDDKPSVKTTVRHSRFTHISSETVTTQSPSTTTSPPTDTSPTTKILNVATAIPTTPSTLSTTSTYPTRKSTHDVLTIFTNSALKPINQNYYPSGGVPLPPLSTNTVESLDKTTPKFISVHSELTTKIEGIAPILETTSESSARLPLGSSISPIISASLPGINEHSKGSYYDVPNVTPSIVSTTSSGTTTVPKYFENQHISRLVPTKFPRKMPTPSVFNDWNKSRQGNVHEKQNPTKSVSSEHLDVPAPSTKVPSYLTPNHVDTSSKPSEQDITVDSVLSTAHAPMPTIAINAPTLSKPVPTQLLSNAKQDPESFTTTALPSFPLGDSITKSGDIPIIPMRTPYRNLNPFIPAPAPTQSHGSLTLPVTETNNNEAEYATGTVIVKPSVYSETLDKISAEVEPATVRPGPYEINHAVVSTHLPFTKLPNQNYNINLYPIPTRKSDVLINSQSESSANSGQPPFNSNTSKTSDVNSDKGIFVFPPHIPARIPSYVPTLESIEEVSPLPTAPLTQFFDSYNGFKTTLVHTENGYFIPTKYTSPSRSTVPFTTASPIPSTPNIDMTGGYYTTNLQIPSYATMPPYFSSSEILNKPPSKNLFTKTFDYDSEKPFISPSLVSIENRKHTASPFDILRTAINSKVGGRDKDSNKRKSEVFGQFNPNPEVTTREAIEPSMVGSILNELSKSDFIAIFRPESDMKNIMPFTVPARKQIKSNVESNIMPFTVPDREQIKSNVESNIMPFTVPDREQIKSNVESNIMPFTVPDREQIKSNVDSIIMPFTVPDREQIKSNVDSIIMPFTVPTRKQIKFNVDSNIMPFTVPAREQIKSNVDSVIMPFTIPEREQIKSNVETNVTPFTVPAREQIKSSMERKVIPFTSPDREQTKVDIDELRTNSIITSTYSLPDKTVTSYNVPIAITHKNDFDKIVTEKLETIPGDMHPFNKDNFGATTPSTIKPITVGKTIPTESIIKENHTVNGKLLEEPSNFLPTVLDEMTTVSKDNVNENSQPSSTQFIVTEVPRQGYFPTDKDFLNLTYILNSINDFTMNNKRGMKQSPKSFMYGNSVKVKLTEKPFFNDLITNTVNDNEPFSDVEKVVSATPTQKRLKQNRNYSSLNNRGKPTLNDSRIIQLNISSHLSFHNPPTTRVAQKFSLSTKDPSLTFNPSFPPDMFTRSVDGKVTTVSIISTVSSKSPTKRSTKEKNFFKTENAFKLNHRPDIEESEPVLESSTAVYNPSDAIHIDRVHSTNPLQTPVSENDEVSKKPFRRKEIFEGLEDEMRPNMTAALSAHSAPAENDSYSNLTAGILATVTCILLVGALSSLLVLTYVYCRKEKPVPMEPCIMAYEPSTTTDPSSIYSVPRPSLLPEIFFCPTFTHNYAAQINKELRELSYDTNHKENSEPVYTEISN